MGGMKHPVLWREGLKMRDISDNLSLHYPVFTHQINSALSSHNTKRLHAKACWDCIGRHLSLNSLFMKGGEKQLQ
jgi:hypothetical protein